MLQISQYPHNADGTPMDLLVGVVTDDTGNGGARLVSPPVGPDGAPIDAKAIYLVDKDGNPISLGGGSGVVVTPQQFGAVANGATDDSAAFVAAIAHLKTIASNDTGIYKGSPKLFIPAGNYFLGTTTLDITHTLIIEGEGSGQAGGNATKLRWAANATGFRIQRYDTSGSATVDGVTHYGGDATILRNMYLEGAYTNFASEGEYHAVHAKARWRGRDLFIRNWQGDGIHMDASTGLPGAQHGNANQFSIADCTTWYCRNGIYISGYDANAGKISGCDTSFNRRFGRADNSVLINTYDAHHSDSNGIAAALGDPTYPATECSYGGNMYGVIWGQEAWCSTNAPSGTTASNLGWYYFGTGAPLGTVRPAWVNGLTWVAGGVILQTQGGKVCVGEYVEGGQMPGQATTLTILGSLASMATATYLWGGNTLMPVFTQAGGGWSTSGDFSVGGNLSALGHQHFIGPDTGAAGDVTTMFRNTNGITRGQH
jgi:hypothetical protein